MRALSILPALGAKRLILRWALPLAASLGMVEGPAITTANGLHAPTRTSADTAWERPGKANIDLGFRTVLAACPEFRLALAKITLEAGLVEASSSSLIRACACHWRVMRTEIVAMLRTFALSGKSVAPHGLTPSSTSARGHPFHRHGRHHALDRLAFAIPWALLRETTGTHRKASRIHHTNRWLCIAVRIRRTCRRLLCACV
mmetsp:Transcript_16589/g.35031  ORF Transcript_16589/g.35031 Transcript_16589/m.35031 type:complete len:202 (+) Transcript_16589:179-784(+)